MLVDEGGSLAPLSSFLKVGNDRSLEAELDKVHGEVPDNAAGRGVSANSKIQRRRARVIFSHRADG